MIIQQPVWVDSIGSTNKEIKSEIEKGVKFESGYVFAAGEQFAGRGRFDRVWKTEKGENLTFSIVISTYEAFPEIATIPMATGLGICNYLREKGLDAKGKWPNDVLVGDSKICGILSEIAVYQGREYIIVGAGVNLNMDRQAAERLDKPATSLFIETGVKSDQKEALNELLPYINESLTLWEEGGFSGIRSDWEKVAWRYNMEVELDNSGNIITGVLVGFGDSGQLIIELPDGRKNEFWSGDVSIKRERS